MQGYEIGILIGEGGRTAVYRGHQASLNRPVAIKYLMETYAADPAFVAHFRQGVRACGMLDHERIVRVYDYGEEDGKPYIITEFLDGITLRSQLQLRRIFSEEQAVHTVIGVLAGLEYAHRHNVVHGSLSLDNVFLVSGSQIKITDFGLAYGNTGNAAYASPEQARNQTTDGRSDIYSMGVILFELLCGEPPFQGDTAKATLFLQVHEPLPELPHTISDTVREVIKKATNKDPGLRFQSAAEMRQALERSIPVELSTDHRATRQETWERLSLSLLRGREILHRTFMRGARTAMRGFPFVAGIAVASACLALAYWNYIAFRRQQGRTAAPASQSAATRPLLSMEHGMVQVTPNFANGDATQPAKVEVRSNKSPKTPHKTHEQAASAPDTSSKWLGWTPTDEGDVGGQSASSDDDATKSADNESGRTP